MIVSLEGRRFLRVMSGVNKSCKKRITRISGSVDVAYDYSLFWTHSNRVSFSHVASFHATFMLSLERV